MSTGTKGKRTVVNCGLLHLTTWDGCPYLEMGFAGNMGHGIDAVDRRLAEIGLPSIGEMRAGCPSFRESGSPDYLYEARVLIGDLSPLHRSNLERATRMSQEKRQAEDRQRQRKALGPRAKALVTRARRLVEEQDDLRTETERRRWEARATQALRAIVEELG